MKSRICNRSVVLDVNARAHICEEPLHRSSSFCVPEETLANGEAEELGARSGSSGTEK